jgi:membrane protein YqaA with SNARE-associated domain
MSRDLLVLIYGSVIYYLGKLCKEINARETTKSQLSFSTLGQVIKYYITWCIIQSLLSQYPIVHNYDPITHTTTIQ